MALAADAVLRYGGYDMRSLMYDAVVIGASCGGMAALARIFSHLPAGYPLPVLVAQHLHPQQDDGFFLHLGERCPLPVKAADEKEVIAGGHIYFAPPNYHLLVEKDLTLALSVDERVQFSRPSVDVLFASAAEAYGSRLVGVVLTGANNDGADGLRMIKERGGLAVAQDPATAVADCMPRAAIAAVAVDQVLAVDEIGRLLAALGAR